MRPKFLMWSWLSAVLSTGACTAQTPGELALVTWQFEQNADQSNADFSTDTGFQVHLDEARLALQAARVYSPQAQSVGAVACFERLFVAVAHAHGGLDAESGRQVRSEITQRVGLDLLAEAPLKFAATADTGAIDALKIELATPTDLPSEFHAAAVYLKGEASRDSLRVPFEATVALGDDLSARSVDLTGLVATLEQAAVLHVAVHTREWLRLAEFDRLQPAAAGDRVNIGADSQVGRALVIGVRSPEAFGFEVSLEP